MAWRHQKKVWKKNGTVHEHWAQVRRGRDGRTCALTTQRAKTTQGEVQFDLTETKAPTQARLSLLKVRYKTLSKESTCDPFNHRLVPTFTPLVCTGLERVEIHSLFGPKTFSNPRHPWAQLCFSSAWDSVPHHIHTGKVCKSCLSYKPRRKGREVGSREWLVLEDRACRLGTPTAPISLHCTFRNGVNSLPPLLRFGLR